MAIEAPAQFEDALTDLQVALPDWWRTRDEESNLYKILWVFGQQLDLLANIWEDIYRDQALSTASREGLIANFAFGWGLVSEEDALGEAGLRAYIEARAKENGSVQSLEDVLLAILLVEPCNTQGGPLLRFGPEGDEAVEGIELPAAGVQLFEFEAGGAPSAGLQFPADGKGLQFPGSTVLLPTGATPAAGLGIPPGGPSIGLQFTEGRYVQINQNTPEAHHLEVLVLNYLAFDRPAFTRAVERFTPADCYTPIIREVPSI